MRFISRGRHYSYGGGKYIGHTVLIDGVPTEQVERWDAAAKFGPTGHMPPPTDAEVKFALERLGWNGLGTTHPDSLEHIVPVHKIGVFDSEVAQELHGWTDDQRRQIERSLLDSSEHGTEFVVFETPKAAKPWPNYDQIKVVGQRTPAKVAEKIAEMTLDLGLDAGSVLAYEQENANRVEVVEALRALLVDAPAVEDEITVAA